MSIEDELLRQIYLCRSSNRGRYIRIYLSCYALQELRTFEEHLRTLQQDECTFVGYPCFIVDDKRHPNFVVVPI